MRGGGGGGRREEKREKTSEPRRLGREECLVGVKDKNNELAAKKKICREKKPNMKIEREKKRMTLLKTHSATNERTNQWDPRD